ncbi:MAG: VOC family protein [Candidatus Eremiobacteraeota bacterium]|nr:VOC family protein [Candidatus Eremiobacteraeota bacterium]
MSAPTVISTQTVYPGMRYLDARAAIDWLQRALGAYPYAVYDGPGGTVAHAEIIVAGNIVMLGSSRDDGYPVRSPKELRGVTGGIYVVLSDAAAIDAMHARAAAAGALITQPPTDTDYGSHDFSLEDPEGYVWTFGTYRPGAAAPA